MQATVQALGQGQRPLDPQGILSVESLMDEIIDRAYDEDDEMGVRDTCCLLCMLTQAVAVMYVMHESSLSVR